MSDPYKQMFVMNGFAWVKQVFRKRSCKLINDYFVDESNVDDWFVNLYDIMFDVITKTVTNVLQCVVWKAKPIFLYCGLWWLNDVVWFDILHDIGESKS